MTKSWRAARIETLAMSPKNSTITQSADTFASRRDRIHLLLDRDREALFPRRPARSRPYCTSVCSPDCERTGHRTMSAKREIVSLLSKCHVAHLHSFVEAICPRARQQLGRPPSPILALIPHPPRTWRAWEGPRGRPLPACVWFGSPWSFSVTAYIWWAPGGRHQNRSHRWYAAHGAQRPGTPWQEL